VSPTSASAHGVITLIDLNKAIVLVSLTCGLPVSIGSAVSVGAQPSGSAVVRWDELPPLPDEHGFAGMYAGVSGGALIVAGGSNYPETPMREGGQPVWYDTIYVLAQPDYGSAKPDGSWKVAEQTLPRPMGCGVSVTYDNAVILCGGMTGDRALADVIRLNWDGRQIQITELPPLPQPAGYTCGALLGSTIFIAGGVDHPEGTRALHTFWALDLSQPPGKMAWQELIPWPGPARRSAVAAAQDGSFFLISGQVEADEKGEPKRVSPYLTDGYRYTPGKQTGEGDWRKIADVPHGVAAAASPALALGESHIGVLSGVDGSRLGTDTHAHAGFSRDIHVYHTITDTWLTRGRLPDGGARVTLPTTPWQGGWVVPSGESAPGRRSPKVLWARPVQRQSGLQLLDWFLIFLYLASLVVMGLYFARRENSTEDFFLGGRRIPWWAAGLSMFGTTLSAISYIAIPAVVYGSDWRRIAFVWMLIPAGFVAVRYFMPFYRRLNVTTAYEYLELRFNLKVRMFASGIFIASQLARVAVVVYLPALALASVTGLNIYACILCMGILCIIYTVLGGIEAVIWTDVIQVLVLMSAAVFALVLVLWHAGGLGKVVQIAAADAKFRPINLSWDITEMSLLVLVVGGFFGMLVEYSAGQATIQRYLTTPDERGAALGIWTSVLMSLFATPIFYALGTALYVFYKLNPQDLTPGKTDEIVPWFVVQQLPVGLSGLVIAGIFAAAMSSLDSAMNSAATAYVNDFHRRLKPTISDHSALGVARWFTALVGLFGTGMAILLVDAKELPIFDMWTVVMSLVVGGMSGVFILAVFTERGNSTGALVGLVVGAITPWVVQQTTDIQFYLYAAIGIVSCVVTGYVASLVLPGDDHDLTGLTVYSMDETRQVAR